MRTLTIVVLLVACIALVHGGAMPKKYPHTRDRAYEDYYDEYPLLRQVFENYFQHNYICPEKHNGFPYFGYPYGDCSSCRTYHADELNVPKPECGCSKH